VGDALALELNNITLAQGDFTLTADLALTSAVTAIIGPSGGGKSTLLSAIAGFLAPQTGQVLWQGDNMTATAPGERPVSMLFQDNNLFPHLTVMQNVGLGLRPNLRLSLEDRMQVTTALDRVGLGGLAARKPAALSGGQQSRVALARVLVADRPLVLLDEPFAALGPALKADMLALVQDVLAEAGKQVVMVTHDPQDAKSIAEMIVVVADGAALGPFETKAVFANPPEPLRAYLGTTGQS